MFSIDTPDAAASAAFYAALLGWETVAEGDGYAMIGDGSTSIGFGTIDDYLAPSWPDTGAKQFHLDLRVDDLAGATDRAVALGATRPDHQPGEGWTVMIDPAGHPFCLCPPSPES